MIVNKATAIGRSEYTPEELKQLLFGDWTSCQDLPKPDPLQFGSFCIPVAADPNLKPGEWKLSYGHTDEVTGAVTWEEGSAAQARMISRHYGAVPK